MTIKYIARLYDGDGTLLAETMASRGAHVDAIFQSLLDQLVFDCVDNGPGPRCLAPCASAQNKRCTKFFLVVQKPLAQSFQVADGIDLIHGRFPPSRHREAN